MLNGLDLFSGIGGLSIALKDWVRPVAYCEIDPYCQGVLLSRMASTDIVVAPIWDDIRTLSVSDLPPYIDILFGGFPCQDISVAGRGKGLEGERSGLFFEIVRLAKEIQPQYLFLENVAAITSRGGIEVVRQIAEMGYDCRWCVISAASVGALHRRERWFLLAYAKHFGSHGASIRRGSEKGVRNASKGENAAEQFKGVDSSSYVADSLLERRQQERGSPSCHEAPHEGRSSEHNNEPSSSREVDSWEFWETEPDVGRVADGVPNRVDRIRGLGNAVVPKQAKEAFEILMGFK